MEIYTGGSVASDESSSAFYIPEEAYERGFKLLPALSSTEAEAFAILSVLRYISSSTPRMWTILSDSKSALEALASYSPKVINDIYTEILCLHATLSSLGHSVWFQWIPGHVGISGNALADSAVTCARAAGSVTSVLLTLCECRLAIHRYCRNSSQAFSQDDARTNPFLRSIDATMTHTLVGRYPREEEPLLHRLRLNVARTPLLLFKMGHLSSPNCPTCHVEEDIPHLLLHCTRYRQHRLLLRSRITRLKISDFSLATLLGPTQYSQVTKALGQFLRICGLLGEL
ncbi:uncharacterized protein LOC135384582 [Ornithodoros turicata]|uniref:uncharacterized protein LOC135384582 n=1 Tax=Ornithodoros turicata TaxID=34597 RepID=UPI003139F286